MGFNWSAFETAEPEFAAAVRARFGQYKHHVLATLRKDGSPRVTGLEVDFRFGEMWLGMMAGSRKAQDLLRDARFAVQANPGAGDDMADGDVRVGGRAVEVTDGMKERFTGEVGPPEPYHLFRVEIGEVVWTAIEDGALVVRVWQPGKQVRTRKVDC